MVLTAAEIESLVRRAVLRSSGRDTKSLRRTLAGLDDSKRRGRREPLADLCAIGVAYGWRELEQRIPCRLLKQTSAKAQGNLRRNLQDTLKWITRPCFELEWNSFNLAAEALGLGSRDANAAREKFLGEKPRQRLFALLTKFPVLAGLWSIAIEQWRNHATQILTRANRDRRAIARNFFEGREAGRITNLRLGLSDRHLGGRSVALVEFERGSVIYKPRAGTTEAPWGSLLRSMNEHGFKPRLKGARIFPRAGYHWMEHIEAGPCRSPESIRRFYQRLGGLIAAAYLSQAVDCHRANLIASGEHPVLVDVEALWHAAPSTRSQSAIDRLYRTGFFPNRNPESLQSRSSVLGKTLDAKHAREIIAGFERGWRCLAGTAPRRASFFRRLRRIRSQKRRWIYGATETYATLLGASLQPPALTSPAARRALLRRLARRSSTSAAIHHAEVRALERLDVPYFTRKTNEKPPAIQNSPPPELIGAIAQALQWVKRA